MTKSLKTAGIKITLYLAACAACRKAGLDSEAKRPFCHRMDGYIEYGMKRAISLLDAWERTQAAAEYLTVRDPDGDVQYFVPSEGDNRLPSQYCRRSLAESFSLRRGWDWRAYGSVEPFLVTTVRELNEPLQMARETWLGARRRNGTLN